MSDSRLFSPADAERITGVSPDTIAAWRRRAILPANEAGGWSKHTIRDLLKLRMIRALIEVGIPVTTSIELLSEGFLDPFYSTLMAQVIPVYQTFFAVVTVKGDRVWRCSLYEMSGLGLLEEEGFGDADTVIVLRLKTMAAEMVAMGVLDDYLFPET